MESLRNMIETGAASFSQGLAKSCLIRCINLYSRDSATAPEYGKGSAWVSFFDIIKRWDGVSEQLLCTSANPELLVITVPRWFRTTYKHALFSPSTMINNTTYALRAAIVAAAGFYPCRVIIPGEEAAAIEFDAWELNKQGALVKKGTMTYREKLVEGTCFRTITSTTDPQESIFFAHALFYVVTTAPSLSEHKATSEAIPAPRKKKSCLIM